MCDYGQLKLPERQRSIAISETKRVDEVAVNLRGVTRCPDMMEEIVTAAEDIRTSCEFAKQCATTLVLVTSKRDLEQKIVGRYRRDKMAAAKGIDSPIEMKKLVRIGSDFVI